MIITVTANPSVDRTIVLDQPLSPGKIQPITAVSVEAGGKGVNVARAIHQAGRNVRAIVPAPPGDLFLSLLDELGLTYTSVHVDAPTRMNLTICGHDGVITKLNELGGPYTSAQVQAFTDLVVEAALGASWIVLSGSLPTGMPAHWYSDVIPVLRTLGCKVAVDTSHEPLGALAERFPASAPDLIKPNSDELAQLSGMDAAQLEADAMQGNMEAIVNAATDLTNQGVDTVLVTLGAAGAVLVNADTALWASPPKVDVKSPIGAGDATVAGYVMAHESGADLDACLATAIAYGASATELAGSAQPNPEHVNPAYVDVKSW
ncbi:1-phosphofructokinase family hexose kinase [Stomatohabitans albus]|uniref:1-phosphofructokinase family hexose kinase n=1 Tax=Stomatohabitans albus TaxID=3110766 RepID=UPI00300CE100